MKNGKGWEASWRGIDYEYEQKITISCVEQKKKMLLAVRAILFSFVKMIEPKSMHKIIKSLRQFRSFFPQRDNELPLFPCVW